jgi:diacylglycerol kinase (ATP)
MRLIENAGCRVTGVSSNDRDLDYVLDQPADLVVVAGGDGTIKKIADKAKPGGPPLTILPLGTANNIATTLGFSSEGRRAQRWTPLNVRAPRTANTKAAA